MYTRRLSMFNRVLASIGIVAACFSVATLPLQAEPIRATSPGAAPEALETFSAGFWAAQFGLPYAPGASAIALTVESVSVTGVGQWDAQVLGDDGVAALEAFAGGPILRTWGATVAGAAAGAGLLPGGFSETYRQDIAALNLTADELAAAGMSIFTRHAAAGLFTGPLGQPAYVYGIVGTLQAVGGQAVSVFVPLGTAESQAVADGCAAILARTGVAAGESGAVLTELLDNEPESVAMNVIAIDPAMCDTNRQLCYQSKQLRYDACVNNANAVSVAATAACATGCLLATIGYPACMAVCGAAVIAQNLYTVQGCANTLAADRIDCDIAYNECVSP